MLTDVNGRGPSCLDDVCARNVLADLLTYLSCLELYLWNLFYKFKVVQTVVSPVLRRA